MSEEHGEKCSCVDCEEVRLVEARIEATQEERYLEEIQGIKI